MAVKFVITPSRFAEACNVIEYMNASAKVQETIIRIAPRFIVDADDKYLVTVTLDDDGDIQSFDGLDAAFVKLASITPKRLEKLIDEFSEAARAVVNPPKERG